MDITSIILLIAFVLMVILFIIGILYQRRLILQRRAQIETMGFSPVTHPDGALVERLRALYSFRQARDFRLESLYHRKAGERDIYLFSVDNSSGDSVAVISPRLRLPRFALLSRIPGSGALVGTANKMLAQGMAMILPTQLSFPDQPGFDQNFWVAAENEAETRAFFTPTLIRRVEDLTNMQLQAGGQILIYANHSVRVSRETLDPQPLKDLVATATRLAGWFEDAGR